MATGKRYFWIKLKESFLGSDAVDFLMGQPDGANYVVLYQILCLKTINTGGKLERHIGEVIVPYDEAKIQRDAKWFTIDTVRVALNLYKALGLVYVDKDGALCLTDHENLVGSETDWAEKRRRQRSDLPIRSLPSGDNVPSNVPQNVPIDIDIENRDKEIDIRDKEIEKEDKERKHFKAPTVDEVSAYCRERGNGVDPQHFVDYYTANGWKVGRNPMKDWKAAVRTWERNDTSRKGGGKAGQGRSSELPSGGSAKRFNVKYDVE